MAYKGWELFTMYLYLVSLQTLNFKINGVLNIWMVTIRLKIISLYGNSFWMSDFHEREKSTKRGIL